jgi:hypothetical protein
MSYQRTITGRTNPAKTFKCLLTQTGTAAPVATVLQADDDITAAFSRTGQGDYVCTFTPLTATTKIFVSIEMGNGTIDTTHVPIFQTIITDTTHIQIITFLGNISTPAMAATDALLTAAKFTLQLFP